MGAVSAPVEVSCAVEVFLAVATLHKNSPDRKDFTIQEIMSQVAEEALYPTLRPGIQVHISQHCVANKVPNPSKHRMLFATGKHTRRLALPNDVAHQDRTGKIFPDAEEIPEKYQSLLEWTKIRFEQALNSPNFLAHEADERVRQLRSDSLLSLSYEQKGKSSLPAVWLEDLLSLRLAGVHLADGVDPDEHVRQLREGWE